MISLKNNFRVLILVAGMLFAIPASSTQTETTNMFFGEQRATKMIPTSANSTFASWSKQLLKKPYNHMLGMAITAGACALAKISHTAWQDNADKDGLEKMRGVFKTLQATGLSRLLETAQKSPELRMAAAAMATEVLMGATKSGLSLLAQARYL